MPQSYSSVLTLLLKLKDAQRTANCAYHKQSSGYAGYSHTVQRAHPPVTSSCSYQNIFIQGEWERKEIMARRAYNEKTAREENKQHTVGFIVIFFLKLSYETEISVLIKVCFRLQSYFKIQLFLRNSGKIRVR